MVEITKTEIGRSNVTVELSDGVTVYLSFNDGYVTTSFTGIKPDDTDKHWLKAGPFVSRLGVTPRELNFVKSSNVLNIAYRPRKD